MSNVAGHGGPVVLVVLDGWGYRAEPEGNAIAMANAPTWARLWNGYPRTLLDASELAVGLPSGQMGNSEVGHLNLGAGRVVPQDLVRISQSIDRGEFYQLPVLQEFGAWLRQSGGTLHLVGLLGPGGVHALDRHLLACVELGVRLKVPHIAIHGFLDGRDSAPTLGAEVVRTLLLDMRRIAGSRVDIASLTGRYYGMDRDKRWDRTRAAYDAIAHGIGIAAEHPVLAVQAAYQRGETDEFVRPLVHHRNGLPVATVKDGDGIFFFNYRSDRMRQIVAALGVEGFSGFDTGRRPAVRCATMTQYDQTFPDSAGIPAVHARAYSRRGPGRQRPDPAAHRGDREVSPRHLLLQRRVRAALQGRGTAAGTVPARRDVRPGARNERPWHHRRAVQRPDEEAARFPALQFRQRRHGGAHRRHAGGDQGGGDGGLVPRPHPPDRGENRGDGSW